MAHASSIFRQRRSARRLKKSLQSLFKKAEQEALAKIERELEVLFSDGVEKHSFRLKTDQFGGSEYAWDAYKTFWGNSPIARNEMDGQFDARGWAVVKLTKEQALAFAKYCALWNYPWESRIAYKRMMQGDPDVPDTSEYEQPFAVGFTTTTGKEELGFMKQGAWGSIAAWRFDWLDDNNDRHIVFA